MKKLLFALFAISSLTLMGCGSSNTDEVSTSEENIDNSSFDMEPVVWTFVDYNDASSAHYQQRGDMVKAIYERTDGLLDIQHHSIGEFPFGEGDLLSVTIDRTVEMSNPSLSYIEGNIPIASIVEWPMLINDNEEMDIALDVLEPYLSEEFNERGVEMLDWWSQLGLGFYGVGDTPQELSDFANRQIRLYSNPITELLLNYDVAPVSMTISEVVPAMQRNVIDAALTGNVYPYDMGWDDIVDWAFIMNISGAASGIFVNSEAMSELPEEVQSIVREEVANYHEVNIEYNETETQESIDGIAERGVEVVYASEEDYSEAIELSEEIWVELAAEIGSEAQEALEAIREELGK